MKKIFQIVVVLMFIAILMFVVIKNAKETKMVTIITNNTTKQPLKIVLHHYQDSDCGMVIDDISYAGEVVSDDGRTWFFHDIGGITHWIEDKSFKNSATIWVMSKKSKKWINAKTAWYSRTDTTPMGYGFGAYEDYQDGFIDFEQMRYLMLRGQTLNNPRIKKELLGHN